MVNFQQEHVDLLVGRNIVLIQQRLVQLVLVSAAVVGGDDPVDGDAFGNFVVLLKEALELFVPCVDVEDLAFRGRLFGLGVVVGDRSGGSGGVVSGSLGFFGLAGTAGDHGQRHNQHQQHSEQLFHVSFSFFLQQK